MEKEETKVVEEQATATNTADDFFSANQASADMKTFISQMKKPREKIEAPPIMFQDEDDDDEEILKDPMGEGAGESDEDMLNHFDYSEEHRYTAEFMLIQLDKFLAFSLSMISGSESDRYRRRKTRMEGDDYEAEILAALVKKYQMRLSLEWMFASAIVIGYAPMVDKAIADRKVNRAQKGKQDGA
jgi:hypothetical protein